MAAIGSIDQYVFGSNPPKPGIKVISGQKLMKGDMLHITGSSTDLYHWVLSITVNGDDTITTVTDPNKVADVGLLYTDVYDGDSVVCIGHVDPPPGY